jgi:hypothetical protein
VIVAISKVPSNISLLVGTIGAATSRRVPASFRVPPSRAELLSQWVCCSAFPNSSLFSLSSKAQCMKETSRRRSPTVKSPTIAYRKRVGAGRPRANPRERRPHPSRCVMHFLVSQVAGDRGPERAAKAEGGNRDLITEINV